MPAPSIDVLVIGAGFSGAVVAERLADHGLKVAIDALYGVAYADDSQLVDIRIVRGEPMSGESMSGESDLGLPALG